MNEKFVYRIFAATGELLYVGSTKDPDRRIAAHKNSSGWLSSECTISIDGPHRGSSADFIEGMAILCEKPKHNKNGRQCAQLPSLDLAAVPQRVRAHDAARPRAECAANLRAAGGTWAAIGRAFGVSRQAAQQLVSRHQDLIPT